LNAAVIRIVAGGEAYLGPPKYKLWADDTQIAEVQVVNAVDTLGAAPVTPELVRSAMRTFVHTVPNIETVKSISIEFSNDKWAGEGKQGDRNLWLGGVAIGNEPVMPSQSIVEIKDSNGVGLGDGLVRFSSPGRLRIVRPPHGWPLSSSPALPKS
jgi:hypothetical protein